VSCTGILHKKQQPGTQRGHEVTERSDRRRGRFPPPIRLLRSVSGYCLSERDISRSHAINYREHLNRSRESGRAE
ncbi:MAG: hypothetical protein FWH27_08595, partial [Planctomycetaceae bacterium]|nr:hypothetical protein [Planctomycetaceae bacterium]